MWTAPAVAGSLPAVMNSRPGSESHSATMAALAAAAVAAEMVGATAAAVVIPPAPAAVPCYHRGVEEEAVAAAAAVDFHHSMPRPHLRPFPRPCPHRRLSQRRLQWRPSNIYNSKHKPTYRRERSCGPTSTITALHHSGISGTSGVYPVSTRLLFYCALCICSPESMCILSAHRNLHNRLSAQRGCGCGGEARDCTLSQSIDSIYRMGNSLGQRTLINDRTTGDES